jgi:hypothetical protein
VSRLALLLISIVAGAALAVGAAFSVTAVLAGSQHTAPSQRLYNYGPP